MQGLVRNEVQAVVLMAPPPGSVHRGSVQATLVKRYEVVHILSHRVVKVDEHRAVRINTDLPAVRGHFQQDDFG